MKKITFLTVISLLLLSFVSCRYVDDASDTAFDEFKASTLLKKYEYFKDVAATLDSKYANLKVYESRFQDLKEQYKDVPRSQWAREDREQYNLWQSEQAGIKASYNDLCSEYNSAMSKFNWRFCNVGTLKLL